MSQIRLPRGFHWSSLFSSCGGTLKAMSPTPGNSSTRWWSRYYKKSSSDIITRPNPASILWELRQLDYQLLVPSDCDISCRCPGLIPSCKSNDGTSVKQSSKLAVRDILMQWEQVVSVRNRFEGRHGCIHPSLRCLSPVTVPHIDPSVTSGPFHACGGLQCNVSALCRLSLCSLTMGSPQVAVVRRGKYEEPKMEAVATRVRVGRGGFERM